MPSTGTANLRDLGVNHEPTLRERRVELTVALNAELATGQTVVD
ncbi:MULTISPECIES: hypothetical protein [unclassified Ensifer]|nr:MULTISPECIES: hypothetical protein [unclassified Ensifer]